MKSPGANRGFSIGPKHPHRKASSRLAQEDLLNDSEFWRSIAAKFRSIFDVANGMRVRWHCIDGSPNIAWEILNEPTPESKMQFCRLAKIAGRRLLSDNPEPFNVWMLKMRETRPNQHVDTLTHESSDGTLHITEIGLILDVLQASANLCDELELELEAPPSSPALSLTTAIIPNDPGEGAAKTQTIGQQIDALRLDCGWTAEYLAERVEITPRSVYRHISDADRPSKLNLAKYQRVFSQQLERKVVIDATSVNVIKRQKKS
jgi:hypothetical protein